MITRPQFTEEDIDKALAKIKERFLKKCKKKGMGIFVSRIECIGKGLEEWTEIVDAAHRQNDDDLIDEFTDMAVVSTLSIISLQKKEPEYEPDSNKEYLASLRK